MADRMRASVQSLEPDQQRTNGLEEAREFALEASSRDGLHEAIRIGESKIARLKQEMATIQAAIAARELRVERLRRVAARWEEEDPKSEGDLLPENFAARQRQRRTSMAWKVRREAYLIFKRVRRPLTRNELLQELRQSGVELRSPKPLDAITKIMWNAGEFESTGEGYWIAGEPVPTTSGES